MNLDLSFEVVTKTTNMSREYTRNCSNAVSACCTRTCTRINASDTEAWDKYLEVNTGVLQY